MGNKLSKIKYPINYSLNSSLDKKQKAMSNLKLKAFQQKLLDRRNADATKIQKWWKSIPKNSWECKTCFFINRPFKARCKVCTPPKLDDYMNIKLPKLFSTNHKLICNHCNLTYSLKTRVKWQSNTVSIANYYRLNSSRYCNNMPNQIYRHMYLKNMHQLCEDCEIKRFSSESYQRAIEYSNEAQLNAERSVQNDIASKSKDSPSESPDLYSQFGIYWTALRSTTNIHRFKFASSKYLPDYLQSIDNDYEIKSLHKLNDLIVKHIKQL